MHEQPKAYEAKSIQSDADLCVKCGLCLPHCPTYGLTQNEADSPRGRIALVQGLQMGLIEQGPGLEEHLDGCLSCRRCEVVCPAKVPYSRILDSARAAMATGRPARTLLTRWLAAFLVPRLGRALLRTAIGMYRLSGAQRLIRRYRLLGAGRMARLESLLPKRAPAAFRRSRSLRQLATQGAPEISVFRGCVSDVLERDVITATEILLSAAGYRVRPVAAQTCCGALHQHGGMLVQAADLARANMRAFDGVGRIASCTTGCAATLKDYADLLPGQGAAFADRVQDFASWLLPHAERLQFRSMPHRVALHLPCTARNVLNSDVALRQLLERIPALEIFPLDPIETCCGAAGSHFVSRPESADQLLQAKLDGANRLAPDLIISANIGCSMHIAGGLRRSGQAAPPVLHPALLLAAALV